MISHFSKVDDLRPWEGFRQITSQSIGLLTKTEKNLNDSISDLQPLILAASTSKALFLKLFFKLPHGKLWVTFEEAVSLTRC